MKKTITNRLLNLKMNDDVYALRRQVIAYIYEAKRIVPTLPRIEVRITEDDSAIAGLASMGKNVIWITKNYVASRGLVFHEILHAVYAQEHVTDCLLMSGKGTSLDLDDDTANKLFLRYARKYHFGRV